MEPNICEGCGGGVETDTRQCLACRYERLTRRSFDRDLAAGRIEVHRNQVVTL